MDPAGFDNTAQIALDYGVIKNEASSDTYVTDYAEAAVPRSRRKASTSTAPTSRPRRSR